MMQISIICPPVLNTPANAIYPNISDASVYIFLSGIELAQFFLERSSITQALIQ
jgi:hypothetical protein